MSRLRRSRALLVFAALALVLAWCLQATDASLWIVWRATVTSWDSPSTQVHDELATQAIADLDATRHLRDHVGATLRPGGPLAPSPAPPGGDAVALGARLTRSPPAA